MVLRVTVTADVALDDRIPFRWTTDRHSGWCCASPPD